MNRRLFAIGDIHGCIIQLLLILDWIENNTEAAQVVFLGDYVDRGPDSKGVLDILMTGPHRPQDEWVFLMGNHEEMMLLGYRRVTMSDYMFWGRFGGAETLNSFPNDIIEDRYLEWVESLPAYYETENHTFVHAGLYPNISPRQHSKKALMWMRDWEDDINDEEICKPGSVGYLKHVVFGHTPHHHVDLRPHCSNLDTGAVYGRMLTCGEFDRDVKGGPIKLIHAYTKDPHVVVKGPNPEDTEGENKPFMILETIRL